MRPYFTFGKYLFLGMGDNGGGYCAFDVKNLIYKNHLLIPSGVDTGILLDFIDQMVEKNGNGKYGIDPNNLWPYESINLDPASASVEYKIGAVLLPDGSLREINALKYDAKKDNKLRFIARRMLVMPRVLATGNLCTEDGFYSIAAALAGLDETMSSCKHVATTLRKMISKSGMTFIVNMDDMCKYMRGEIEYKDVEVCNYTQEMADKGKTVIVDLSKKLTPKRGSKGITSLLDGNR